MSNLRQNIELLIWSPGTKAEPPRVITMSDALALEGFRSELAEAVPVTTAFRRAVNAKQGRVDGEDYRATVWQNGRLRGQIDRLDTDPDTHRIRRTWVAGWVLTDDTGVCEGGPDDISEHVKECMRVYTWADVSGVVQRILKEDGMGAYSLRRSGGVYVVPTTGRGLLDRLGRMGERIGLNVLRYDIPDNRAQRDEIQGAIFDSLSADCDEHQRAMDGYTPEQTKPGIVTNRLEAIVMTRQLTERLAVHLGERSVPLLERIADLLARCYQIEAAVKAFRPVSGGRRIAFVSQSAA